MSDARITLREGENRSFHNVVWRRRWLPGRLTEKMMGLLRQRDARSAIAPIWDIPRPDLSPELRKCAISNFPRSLIRWT